MSDELKVTPYLGGSLVLGSKTLRERGVSLSRSQEPISDYLCGHTGRGLCGAGSWGQCVHPEESQLQGQRAGLGPCPAWCILLLCLSEVQSPGYPHSPKSHRQPSSSPKTRCMRPSTGTLGYSHQRGFGSSEPGDQMAGGARCGYREGDAAMVQESAGLVSGWD